MNRIRQFMLATVKSTWVRNGVVGSCLFATGDVIEQAVEIKYSSLKQYSIGRTGRMALMGFTQGPGKQLIFWSLERMFPGRSASAIWKKVVLDQLVSCPLFYFAFFMGMGIMEGKSAFQAWEEFLRKFPTVYVVDLFLWTPVQIITFRFIPVPHRVLFVNSFTVIWNIFLSYIKHFDQFENPRVEECCRLGTCSCHQNFISFSFFLQPFKREDKDHKNILLSSSVRKEQEGKKA